MAPYTGDPTWDYFNAAFMALFTIWSAPWVLGILFNLYQKKSTFIEAYVSYCFLAVGFMTVI